MAIDLSPLEKAVARLEEGLERYARDTSDAQIRDGLIQRFEFAYDLAHKMVRRALEQAAANPAEIDRMGFPDLIRTASEQGLVAGDWPHWRVWRDMRNITSHTYDEAKAVAVVAAIPSFLAEAQALLPLLLRATGERRLCRVWQARIVASLPTSCTPACPTMPGSWFSAAAPARAASPTPISTLRSIWAGRCRCH